jgi:hypothetical protein
MPKPTVNEVLGDVRGYLGDPNTQVFPDSRLAQFFGFAYRRLTNLMAQYEIPRAENEAYPVVPAHTNVLYPERYGITDMAEPVHMQERGGLTEVAISGISNASPMVVTTSSAHGLTNGEEVEIYGVAAPASANWRWFVTVVDSTRFSLNGSVAGGAWTSGGSVVKSADEWAEVRAVGRIDGQRPESDRIEEWAVMGDRIVLTPATEARQLRIRYTVSSTAPTSGTIGVNNSRDYLALQTAALAAAAYDMDTVADRCEAQALGNNRLPNGSGGALRELINPMVLALQKTPARVHNFRERRF